MTKSRLLISTIVVLFSALYLLWNNASRFDSLEENHEFVSTRLEHYVGVELNGYSINEMNLAPNYPKKKISSPASLLSNDDIWVYNWEAQTAADVARGKVIVSASGQTTIFGELANGTDLGTRSY